MSTYAHPASLVRTQWVADHLGDPRLRFVEIVWGASPAFGKPAYDSRHIPGAVVWDFENDLQSRVGRDVLERLELETLLSRSGVSSDTTIVLYSALNNLLATYAFWMLKVYRHEDVRLLDEEQPIEP